MKNPIDLGLPVDLVSRVANYLHETMTLDELTQDILSVELRNSFLIDVGWYPENDPTGSYWIRVFGIDWSQQITQPFKTQDVQEVVHFVRTLVDRFGGSGAVSIPDSSDAPSGGFITI